jgi:uncharacterized protein (TIGR00369 family)
MTLGCPFLDEIPHRVVASPEGVAIVEIDVIDPIRGPAGSVHGGVIASLLDVAGALVVAQTSGRPMATTTIAISYVGAARIGPIRAEATILRIAANHAVSDIRAYDEGKDRRLIAVGQLTVSFLAGDDYVPRAL